MKIALLGYGKMGKVIERIALERGHEIVVRRANDGPFEGMELADVAIDFSIPEAAIANISYCLEHKIPIVSGTTGWLNDYHKMVTLCEANQAAFIYGSNFSLGVNLFFELNDYLAKMMMKFKEYDVEMEEIHHTQKLDKPSGTAISLANSIINHTQKNSWSIENNTNENLFINVKRIDEVHGTHTVLYSSVVDSIEIKHIAHSRDGFALGALIAAEWIIGKTGVFTMKDVLNLTDSKQ
jgi:4-hydroxy-tetrahydrodipicolinate reductase